MTERTPGAQAALANAAFVIQPEEDIRAHRRTDPTARFWERAWMCLTIATNWQTFEALLCGLTVHPDALNHEWLEHFRRRGLWQTT